jgi:hypothetical protein
MAPNGSNAPITQQTQCGLRAQVRACVVAGGGDSTCAPTEAAVSVWMGAGVCSWARTGSSPAYPGRGGGGSLGVAE